MSSTPPEETPEPASPPPPPSSDDWSATPPPPPPPPSPDFSTPVPPPSPDFGSVPPPSPDFGSVPMPPLDAAQAGVRYDVPQDQKNLALISTLGMLIAGFISPLIVFVLTNGDPAKRFANDHAKEGLNFSIVYFVGWAISFVLMFVLVGFLLIPLLLGWGLWVIISGAIQANNGEAPHYPLVPKILK